MVKSFYEDVRYFSKGERDSYIIKEGGKIIIANKNSDINQEGYAIVREMDEKEKCIIVNGESMIFNTLPENYNKFIYDPRENRHGVDEKTIEFWEAVDATGSKYIICKFKLSKYFKAYGDDFWYYDIFCFYNGEFYSLPHPPHVKNSGLELYLPYFTLVKKIEKTGNDIKRYFLTVENNRLKLITLYHKSSPIDSSSLNRNLVIWRYSECVDTAENLIGVIDSTLSDWHRANKYTLKVECLDK